MLKLSDRMQTIANHVAKGSVVADIGTDHGYIPIWLVMEGICDRAILADVNEGPLSRARDNIKKYTGREPDDSFDLRLGDGIRVLNQGDADTVIIAGMGGILIKSILEECADITSSLDMLILQPRNNAHILRSWLRAQPDLAISCEEVVNEAGKYSEIITVKKTSKLDESELAKIRRARELEAELELPEEICCEFSTMYIVENDSVINDFLNQRLNLFWSISERIGTEGKAADSEDVRFSAERKAEYIRKLIWRIGTEKRVNH